MRIGIDLMGSDSSPQVLFEAVLQAAEQFDASHTFVVVASHNVVEELISTGRFSLPPNKSARIEFQLVSDIIEMGDEPLYAVRHKKGSSLVIGIRLLKKRMIDALVSAGNTGALIASASLQLPMLPGINRPGLLAQLPTQKGSVAVIDVGGNVSSKAHHLIHFAHMGAAFQRSSKGIEHPKVGLLNIGVESKKGHAEVRQAYHSLMEQAQLAMSQGLIPRMQFIGNIEGREVFEGKVDVLVTDGFTGNVLLKTTEGAASFIFGYLQEIIKTESSENVRQAFKELHRLFSYSEYPGALICGVDGIIVKCHGNSSSKAMLNGICGAANLIKRQLLGNMKKELQESMKPETRN